MIANERTRNHAADFQLALEHFARDFAVTVQIIQRHDGFVCRNLEHAVRRRIDDELAGLEMFLAQLIQNRRAGRRLVADGAASDCLFVFLDEILREAVRERRERMLQLNARDFPVSGRRILAGGNLAELAVAALRRIHLARETSAVDILPDRVPSCSAVPDGRC